MRRHRVISRHEAPKVAWTVRCARQRLAACDQDAPAKPPGGFALWKRSVLKQVMEDGQPTSMLKPL